MSSTMTREGPLTDLMDLLPFNHPLSPLNGYVVHLSCSKNKAKEQSSLIFSFFLPLSLHPSLLPFFNGLKLERPRRVFVFVFVFIWFLRPIFGMQEGLNQLIYLIRKINLNPMASSLDGFKS